MGQASEHEYREVYVEVDKQEVSLDDFESLIPGNLVCQHAFINIVGIERPATVELVFPFIGC